MLVLFKQYLLTNTLWNFVIGSCSSKDYGHNLKPAKYGEQRTVWNVMHICTIKMFALIEESKYLCVVLLAILCFLLISATFCKQIQKLNKQ